MFTKADLKNGDVCVQRDGLTEIYLNDSAIGPVFLAYGRNGYFGWNFIDEQRDDLTSNSWDHFDIVKVFRPKIHAAYGFLVTILEGQPNECWECVFERKKTVEMTLEEVCEALGKEIKIVKEH